MKKTTFICTLPIELQPYYYIRRVNGRCRMGRYSV